MVSVCVQDVRVPKFWDARPDMEAPSLVRAHNGLLSFAKDEVHSIDTNVLKLSDGVTLRAR